MAVMTRVFRAVLPLAFILSFVVPAAAGRNPGSTQLTIDIPRSNSDVSGRIAAPRSFDVQLTRVF